MVVCSTKASELPGNNLRCFENAAVCEANCAGPSLTAKQKDNGYFYDDGYQPTECVRGTHYCYCTGSSYELAYKIPNPDPSKPPIGEVTDLGSYVNIVYKYLLGISATVAIVMIMIGGIQYVTAVGTGNVKAAKERIKNAVVGILLLFCAALILQTVNPRLLTLQPPRLPAMKRIELLTDDNNCQVLADKGYQIQVEGRDHPKGAPAKACGVKGTVLKDATGTAVAEGTVCTFRTCSDTTKSCFISGDKAECIACTEAVPTNETGLIPTSSVCAQLQKGMTPKHGTDHPYCFWTRDPSMMFGANSDTVAAAIGAGATAAASVANPILGAAVGGLVLTQTDVLKLRHGTCAELRVDCAAIAIANDNKTSCEAYNVSRLEAVNTLTDNELYDLEPGWGDQDMKKICEANPCKWAGGCTYDGVENKCRTSGSGVNLAGCTADSQCDNGNVCIIGHCVRPNPNIGSNGQPCREDGSCNGSLACVRALPNGGGGYTNVCTDGAIGSPCEEHVNCGAAGYCSEDIATRTRCVAKKRNGTDCDDAEECQSGRCVDKEGLLTGDWCQP